MLETKQKSQADAEEEKRKMQQSALAKYRQAFTSDTEVRLGSQIEYIERISSLLPSSVFALMTVSLEALNSCFSALLH